MAEAGDKKLEEAWRKVARSVVNIVKAVGKYPELTDYDINERATRPYLGRDYEVYPDPFPRDGSILLPDEYDALAKVADTLGGFFPERTSPAYRLSIIRFFVQRSAPETNVAEGLAWLAAAVKIVASLDEEWEFVYPVENLVIQVDRLKMGPVTIYPSTTGDKFLRWRQREMGGRFKVLKPALRAEPSFLDYISTCDSWASVRTQGDSILAEERAYDLISRAVDILRLYLAKSETVGGRGSVNFGLAGQATTGELEVGLKRVRVDSSATRTRTFQTLKKQQSYGPAAKYKAVLTPDRLSKIREEGLDTICGIIGKAQPSELEKRVVRAVTWFSQAVISHDEIDRFLKLVFAIDALLGGGPQGEGATTDIAERAALVLADTMKARRNRKKDIVQLFRIRGPLAHGGRSNLEWSRLFWAELWCGELIREFVVNQMERDTFDAFLDWVENEKFG